MREKRGNHKKKNTQNHAKKIQNGKERKKSTKGKKEIKIKIRNNNEEIK